ncbi:MAG: PadR family transcriptional regulator [Candidatus Bathyarchaeota archaeon]|nr:PadR family transcriptional regulator [Candidatus Bathyarchaeota archaeon]
MLDRELEKFRQKGALSPEKAMTIEELGLSDEFKVFLRNSPRLFGVFVEVDGKYYLSEEKLKKIEHRVPLRPLKQWLRHTASVPKGLLRFYVFKLLKEKPMSGSEIMEDIEKLTGGQWKPSPGSVYPLLTWLKENGYAEELPKEVSGIKRYTLTETGRKFFEENTNFENKLQKKVASIGPLFFLRMGLNVDGLQCLQEPVQRFFDALFDLRHNIRENVSEKTLAEVEQFLNDASEKIEKLNEEIKRS